MQDSLFNGFELQISQQGNNTFGEKDDTLYASRKIDPILRRIMPHIYANPTLRTSLKNRVHTHRIDKKFVQLSTAIKEKLNTDSYIPDPNIVEEVCLIQLIHEIERQQLMKNKQTNILTSMTYTFTIQKLLQS